MIFYLYRKPFASKSFKHVVNIIYEIIQMIVNERKLDENIYFILNIINLNILNDPDD